MATQLSFIDFDLVFTRVEGAQRRYVITARVDGGAADTQQLDLDDAWDALEALAQGLGRQVAHARSAIPQAASQAAPRADAQRFGQQLFALVFGGALQKMWWSANQSARDAGQGLRIRLSLEDAPALSLLPWEFLHDDDDFVSIDSRRPIVRTLQKAERAPSLIVDGAVRILAVVAAPSDLAPLDGAAELTRLQAALAATTADRPITVEVITDGSWDSMRKALLRPHAPPHIVHFIGHGVAHPDTGGALAFCNAAGRAELRSGPDLARLLRNAQPRLVVLNACKGATADAGSVFSSLAAHLMRYSVSAVVAMQYEISDAAAIAFSAELYRHLANGYPVDAALGLAREAEINRRDGRALEWGTPVLYLRARSGDLFGSPEEQAAPDPIAPISPIEQRRAVVIGIGDYAHFAPIESATGSAAALEQALAAERAGFALTTLADPEVDTVKRTLERAFVDADPDTLLLVHVVGRGLLDRRGAAYLAAIDTDRGMLRSTAIRLSWLWELIEDTDAGQVLISLDVSFAHARPERQAATELGAALVDAIGQGRAKYLMVSATGADAAIEAGTPPRAAFTEALAATLDDGSAAAGDGVVNAASWFRAAAESVRATQPDRRPRDWAFDLQPAALHIAQVPRDDTPAAVHLRADPAFRKTVAERLARNRCIPVVGAAVHGTGPLSAYALTQALAQTVGLTDAGTLSLVTVAEYGEKRRQDRIELLELLADEVRRQAAQASPRATHRLLARAAARPGRTQPLILISTAYDDLLERAVTQAGVDPVVVTHVQTSEDVLDYSLIAHRPRAGTLERTTPETFVVEPTDCVIYKPLGAPYLNDLLAEHAPDDLVDTVVITETDYVRFVGNLQHEQTRIPNAFMRAFRRRSSLFLGFPLDAWHYRLITRIMPVKAPQVVRQPTSPVEQLAWDRLGADVVRDDPEALARSLLRHPALQP